MYEAVSEAPNISRARDWKYRKLTTDLNKAIMLPGIEKSFDLKLRVVGMVQLVRWY